MSKNFNVADLAIRRIPASRHRADELGDPPTYMIEGHPFGSWVANSGAGFLTLRNVSSYENPTGQGSLHLTVRGVGHYGSVALSSLADATIESATPPRPRPEHSADAIVCRRYGHGWSRAETFGAATPAAEKALTEAAEEVAAEVLRRFPYIIAEGRVASLRRERDREGDRLKEAEAAFAKADRAYAAAVEALHDAQAVVR